MAPGVDLLVELVIAASPISVLECDLDEDLIGDEGNRELKQLVNVTGAGFWLSAVNLGNPIEDLQNIVAHW